MERPKKLERNYDFAATKKQLAIAKHNDSLPHAFTKAKNKKKGQKGTFGTSKL